MKLGFTLNGEDVVVDTFPENRLVDILRNAFGLHGTKAGCLSGCCGSCSILFNGEVVKSCLIPAFKIRGSRIVTIEGFSRTDEYRDILDGFSEAGIDNCGYCDAGKILCAEALLNRNHQPSKEEILLAFNEIRCRCTDPEGLVRGITAAIEYRRRRSYGR
jgi:carbon-monoxide dehydrogenase small subunit